MQPLDPMRVIRAIAAIPGVSWIEKKPDYILAVAVASLVGMLIVPLPSMVLDGFIALNISISLVILLVALFARNALDVTAFPSLLLVTTLFRLSLNVSTTRGILARAEAGQLVQAFGDFVVQGDVVVGIVIFLVVTLVQFMVVAKGAERVAEVGARFTLDAMPGKQMSIDAALRQGSIDEDEAQEQRDELNRLSQMFGNMDGAMKFVKGDTIAGLIITAINLVGGILIGVTRMGMEVGEAVDVYCILTVGDALVAQIASLLITLASGILVTRVEAKDKDKNLGFVVSDEIIGNHKVMFIGSGILALLAFMPGLPFLPFFCCSLIVFFLGALKAVFPAVQMAERPDLLEKALSAQEQLKQKLDQKLEEAKVQKSISDSMAPSVVPITIDLDPVLSEALGFTGPDADERTDLLSTYIPQLRDALFLETGVRFPGVRVRPHSRNVPDSSFILRVEDVPVVQESIPGHKLMATVAPAQLERLAVQAEPFIHPVTKTKMSLIDPDAKDVVEAAGISTWKPAGIIALYVASALRTRTKTFLGIQEVSELIERLEKAYPNLVKEVVPKVTTLQQLVAVLKRLVDENVCIRNLKGIVEALGECGDRESDPVFLTERVRAALAAQLAYAYAGMDQRMPVVLLDPVIEDTIASAIHQTPQGLTLSLENEICRQIVDSIAAALQPVVASGKRPVILTQADVRRFVRKLVEVDLPQVAVVSFDELPPDLSIQPMGRAELTEEAAAA